jgi:predicted DNA-binding transcriptional regulator YafY
MSEIIRLYSYKNLFAGRRALGKAEIMARLEISEATFKRDIAKLRDQLHMPIAFDRDLGGYTMAPGHDDTELPGLWFNRALSSTAMSRPVQSSGFFDEG